MNTKAIPRFSVGELNKAIGNLLSRGFAPRFLLNASVSKSQLKNGHLWLTLTDGNASVSAVIWSSVLQNLEFCPKEEDGVEIFGKLNFWENRANLIVQVINVKPTLSTVLRQFEVVSSLLIQEGLIDDSRRRELPRYPKVIALLTSVPSSAYADMLRTARERWPLTKLLICPIPVQGEVSGKIQAVLDYLANSFKKLKIEAVVLARGGGSREDLMVFDHEKLCRQLASFPIPVITGLGHEDDLTVADLVSDHRAATPTAAIVDLLPSREIERNNCAQIKKRFQDYLIWTIQRKRQTIAESRVRLVNHNPLLLIKRQKQLLQQRNITLNAYSPKSLLSRGFSIVSNIFNEPVNTITNLKPDDSLNIELSDGYTQVIVKSIFPNTNKQ